MAEGWVYVLVNSSIPGAAKVGRTTRPPPERAAELSAATGVAMRFIVAFEQEFADCERAERAVHAELDRRGCRISPNREFFRGPTNDIIRVVLEVAAAAGLAPPIPPSPKAAVWLARGDGSLFGMGESLQDVSEACRCYRLAMARGSLVALERLGAIYAQLKGRGRAGRRRALRTLKDGAKRGNYYCYIEMATLFGAEGHAQNVGKSWDNFFARRSDSFLPEVEEGMGRYMVALRRYMIACVHHRMTPTHIEPLNEGSEELVRSLHAEIDDVRGAPEARQQLATVLRWAHENLVPPGTPRSAPTAVAGAPPSWLGTTRPPSSDPPACRQ